MRVHHASHSVETEAIKHVYVHVISQVRKQKAQDLVVPIVEEPRIPELMTASCTLVEVLVVWSIEFIDAEN